MSECKFKVGDIVRIIASKYRLDSIGIDAKRVGEVVTVDDINHSGNIRILTKSGVTLNLLKEDDLELVPVHSAPPTTFELRNGVGIRTFDTGATRDTDIGKLDFTRALCPLCEERYVQYLAKHRVQTDGSIRDFDNWKRGLPIEESLSSLGRHYHDAWKMLQGYKAHDNHGECNIEDTLCAIRFNVTTILHEILIGKQNETSVCKSPDKG